MNISKDIKTVTYLKSRAADLLKQINETNRPVIITQNGEPRVVLQDPESYQNMRNTIGILKLIIQGEDEIVSNDQIIKIRKSQFMVNPNRIQREGINNVN